MELNPFAWVSGRVRGALFVGGGLVPGDARADIGCLAVFAGGLGVFERLSPHFEEFL
jgi:hypothetical protein